MLAGRSFRRPGPLAATPERWPSLSADRIPGVRKGEVPSTAFDSLYRLSSNRNGLTLTLRLGQI